MKRLVKKSTALLLVVVMLTSILMTNVFAETSIDGDWEYDVNGENATITGYNGTETELTIPSEIDSYTITGISYDAFEGTTSLISVTIPDSVTNVGYVAFSDCSSLENIYVDESNKKYKSVDGILYALNSDFNISYVAFCPEGKTGDVVIADGVTFIEGGFYNCNKITSITLPVSLNTISTSTNGAPLQDCASLENIYVAEGNTEFKSIDGVVYSVDGTTIYRYPTAREGEFTIPESVTTISVGAFSGCSNLTKVEMTNNIDSIKIAAFLNCTNLEEIVIPENITEIEFACFYGCDSLVEVYISDKIEFIDSWALSGANLESITVAETNPNYCSIDGVLYDKDITQIVSFPLGKTGNYIIPEELKFLQGWEFQDCSLTSLTLPTTWASIEGNISVDENVLIYIQEETDEWIAFAKENNITYKVATKIETSGDTKVETSLDKEIPSDVFTKEELDGNEHLKIELSVNEIKEFTQDEQKAIDDLSATLAETYKSSLILDIDLTKYVGETATSLTSLAEETSITIDIPEAMQGKILAVIRIHDDVAEVLTDTDDNDATFTFKTDKFSTYTLVEVEKTETSKPDITTPQTGDSNVSKIILTIMLSAVLAMALIGKKKFVK